MPAAGSRLSVCGPANDGAPPRLSDQPPLNGVIGARIFECQNQPASDGAVTFGRSADQQALPVQSLEFEMPDNHWICPLYGAPSRGESASTLRDSAGLRRRFSGRSADTDAATPLGHRQPISISRFVCALITACLSSGAQAQLIATTDEFRFSYAPSAIHRSGLDGHVKYNNLFSAELLTERWRILGADRTTIGAAIFNNSFGQPCQYVFAGPEWDLKPLLSGWVFANVTAGALHGYTGVHQDKIPFNRFGTAPAAIPSIGWRYAQAAVVMSLLGNSGVLISFSWSLSR